jgi:hypothetical protein
MSSPHHLYVADYPILEGYREVSPDTMILFRERDKRLFERQVSDRNTMTWGNVAAEEGDETETAFEYRATAKEVRERLNVMGFTTERAKLAFAEGRQTELERQTQFGLRVAEPELQGRIDLRQGALNNMTFDIWVQSLTEILAHKPPSLNNETYKDSPNYPYIYLLLWRGNDTIFDPFLPDDYWLGFRALLEAAADSAQVVLDLTDVFVAGYYDESSALCEEALDSFADDYTQYGKIIILTEGSSDIAVLSESLRLLYPHLYDYYSFMDFHTPNMQGGAPGLVSIIKAFIGSGIPNRVVAVFDNDTAAADALIGLANITLPDNIRVIMLPTLDFAKSYPTIGPYGSTPMNTDINSLACSIELFFGEQVLLDDQGVYIPVQWRGYNNALKRYQGEIQNKGHLQEKFRTVVADALQDAEKKAAHDWSTIDRLWQHIFSAFA